MKRYHCLIDVWVTALNEDHANDIIGTYRVAGSTAVLHDHPDAELQTQTNPVDTETPE